MGGCGAQPLPGAPASKYPTITIADATERILAAVPMPRVVQETPLAEARAHVLARDVVAPEPLPPFPASIKDGYAVVSSDGPGDYEIVSSARCGDAPDYVVKPNTVAYITTGGPVPRGADAVVMVERTNVLPVCSDGKRRVRILEGASKGQDIRPVGCDIQAGQTVLRAGDVLGPGEIGLLAGAGAATVQVFVPAKVAVMSSGDEVVDPATEPGPLKPGQIRDSNRSMLLAAAQACGARTLDLGIASDTKESIAAKFEAALEWGADVLLTSGGVSMGDRDLIKPLLEERGTVHFGRVLMKPGKPLTFATLQSRTDARPMLVFGLPGNPVSSLVCFHLCVVPALRKMAGWPDPSLRRVTCQLAQTLKMDPERPEYHRATLSWGPAGNLVAHSTGGGLSSRLLSAKSANALLELPMKKGHLPVGSTVSALLISDLCGMPVHHQVPDTFSMAQARSPPQPDATLHFSSSADDAARLCLAGLGGGALMASCGGGKLPNWLVLVGGAAAVASVAVLGRSFWRKWSLSQGAMGGMATSKEVVRAAVLTISDTVAAGKAADRGGPSAVAALKEVGDQLGGVAIVATAVVSDDAAGIQTILKKWCDSGMVDFVITTGGTGFTPRDVTPEATRPLLDREAPGLVAAMLKESLLITPTAMLSRQVAGIRKSTLVINMPGNPKAVGECLSAIMPALPLALRQMRGLVGKPNHVSFTSYTGQGTRAPTTSMPKNQVLASTGCGCDH